MSRLCFFLFGKFQVQAENLGLIHLHNQKVRELLWYLLLHRDRPHPRETLAAMLWGENPTSVSKKYLRHALWQLQSAIDRNRDLVRVDLLVVEPEWVQINTSSDIWLDVAEVEQAFSVVKGVKGSDMPSMMFHTVHAAIQHVKGDLLEGCYRDWCLYERERFHNMRLALLDKLVRYCETHGEWELGIGYATEVLRLEPARECTHRDLMRIYCLSRDRTAALRQYSRCVAALNENLGVRPARRTVALYEEIQADRLDSFAFAAPDSPTESRAEVSSVQQALMHLRQLNALLANVETQLRQELQVIEQELNAHRSSL